MIVAFPVLTRTTLITLLIVGAIAAPTTLPPGMQRPSHGGPPTRPIISRLCDWCGAGAGMVDGQYTVVPRSQ